MDDLTTLSYGSAHTQPPHLARPHGRGKPIIRTAASNTHTASAHGQNITSSTAPRGRHHSHPLSSGSGSSRAESRGTVQSSPSHDSSTATSSSSLSSSSLPHTRRASQASGMKERGVQNKQKASAAGAITSRTSSSSPPSHHHHHHHRSGSRRRGSSSRKNNNTVTTSSSSQQHHPRHHSRPHRHRRPRSTSHHTARHSRSAHSSRSTSSRSASRKDEVIMTQEGTNSNRLVDEEAGADAWPQRARSSSPSSLLLLQQQHQPQSQVGSHGALPPSPRRQYVTDLLRDARPPSSLSSPSHLSPRRRSTEKDTDTMENKDTRGVGSAARRPSRSVTFDVHPMPSSSSSTTAAEVQHHTLVQRQGTVGESASDAVRALESTHNATQQQLEVVYRLYRRLRSHNASLEGEFRKLRAMLVQLRHKLAKEIASRVQRAQQDMHALREFVRLVLGDYQDGLQHTQRVLLAVLTQPALLASETPASQTRDVLQAQYSQPLHRLSAASHHSQDWYKTLSPLPSYDKAAQLNETENEEYNDRARVQDEINDDRNDAHSPNESVNDAGDVTGSGYRPPSSRSYRDWPALSIVRGNDTAEEVDNNHNHRTGCDEGVGGQTLQLLGSSPSPSAAVRSRRRSTGHTPHNHRAGNNYYNDGNTNTPVSIPSPSALLLQLSSQPESNHSYHEDNNNNSNTNTVRETLSVSTEDNEASRTHNSPAVVSYSHGEMRVRLAAAQKQVVLLSRKMAQSEQHWHARLGRLREIHMAREMALKEQVRLLQLELAHAREPGENVVHEEQVTEAEVLHKEKKAKNNTSPTTRRRTASAFEHTAAELRVPSTNTAGVYAAGGQTAAVPPPPSAIRKAVRRVASAQDNLKTKAASRELSDEARRNVSPSLASQPQHRAQLQPQPLKQRHDEGMNDDDGDAKMSTQVAWARQLLAARGVAL